MYNFQYFVNVFKTLNDKELKALFIKLAHIHHPDKGGDTEAMQDLNNAYQYQLEQSRKGEEQKEGQKEIDTDLINKINSIIKYHDLEIEILGSWIWVTGNTKEHKDSLKANGFFYATKKTAWYYRKEEQKKRRFKSDYSMDQIRERHGSNFQKRTAKLS
jgi:curved DNA-binding protein CbpA